MQCGEPQFSAAEVARLWGTPLQNPTWGERTVVARLCTSPGVAPTLRPQLTSPARKTKSDKYRSAQPPGVRDNSAQEQRHRYSTDNTYAVHIVRTGRESPPTGELRAPGVHADGSPSKIPGDQLFLPINATLPCIVVLVLEGLSILYFLAAASCRGAFCSAFGDAHSSRFRKSLNKVGLRCSAGGGAARGIPHHKKPVATHRAAVRQMLVSFF